MPAKRTGNLLGAHRRWGWGLGVVAAIFVAGLVLVAPITADRPGPAKVGSVPGRSAIDESGAGHLVSPSVDRGPPGTGGRTPQRPGHPVPVTANRFVVSDIERSGSLLVIPSLGVRAPLVPTGAIGAPETASLTIPSDIHDVGWWDGEVRDGDRTIQEDAPAPGQPGVALIAGHVDSAAAGPGALFALRDLKVGDVIEISGSVSHLSTWVVDATPQMAPKAQLPPQLWVTTGRPQLALVTCGGPFDYATGHYVDNVIVWARQVDQRPAK